MKKRIWAYLLTLVMVVGLFPVPVLAEEVPSSITLQYDDRYPIKDKKVTKIESKEINSNKVGTQEQDTAVLTKSECETNLIATGVGTAVVTWEDGTTTEFTVDTAPISLFMITGHSLGAGQVGNAGESICCEDGQVYSTHESDSNRLLSTVTDVSEYGIGYSSAKKPTDIDAMTSGPGVRGNDSGIAYRWNQLTDEKVWVLNAGRGGTNLDTWKKGGSDYQHAVKLFQKAEEILANEIEAGHYTPEHMGILNHTTANGDQIWAADKYEKAFCSMWEGFKEDLSYDMDNDGNEETVDCIGLLPIWNVCPMNKWNEMKEEPQAFYNDTKDVLNGKLVNYAMSAFGDDVVMASSVGREWCKGDEAVKEYFDKHPITDFYEETHNGRTPDNPTSLKNGVYGDGVHYNQLGYNITGMEAAESLYQYWEGNTKMESCRLLQKDGVTEVPESITLKAGETYIIVPECTPAYGKTDFLVSGDKGVISYENCIVTAEKDGTATLEIGEKQVEIKVSGEIEEDPSTSNSYRWTFDDDSMDTVDNKNSITKISGTAEVSNGMLTAKDAVLKLANPITLDPDQNWSVEITGRAQKDQNGEITYWGPLLSTTQNLSNLSIWVTPRSGNVCFVQNGNGGYKWYMASMEDRNENFPKDYDPTETHTYCLMNTKGTLSYWLDGKKVGDLTAYAEGTSDPSKAKPLDTPIKYSTFIGQYIGVSNGNNWDFTGEVDQIEFHEDAAVLTFDPGLEVATSRNEMRVEIGDTITLPNVEQENYNMHFVGWKLGNEFYEVGEQYTVDSYKDITFYGQWETLQGQYLVTIPAGQHVTIEPEEGYSSVVEEGGDYKFKVAIEEGYEKTDEFQVFANEVPLIAEEDIYTISDIREQQTITVTGVIKSKTPEEIYAESVVTLYTADGKKMQDALTNATGSYSIDPGEKAVTIEKGRVGLKTQAQFELDQNWVIEFDYQAKEKSSKPVFSDEGKIANNFGNTSIWVRNTGEICLTYKENSGFYWYGTKEEPEICKNLDITENHTYRIVNQDGKISYSIDGTDCGELWGYSISGFDRKKLQQGAPKFDFSIGFIGAKNEVTNADWWLYGTIKEVTLCEDTATLKFVKDNAETYEYFKLVGEKVILPSATEEEKEQHSGELLTWSDGKNTYADGAEYIVSENGETIFRAEWKAKETLPEFDNAVQSSKYDGFSKSYILASDLSFTIQYIKNGSEVLSPTAVGTYDVIISRPEDETHLAFHQIISGGLVITPADYPVSIIADKNIIFGSGIVDFTVDSSVPDITVVNVICSDAGIKVEDNGDGTYSAALPNRTKTYTFTAETEGDMSNYGEGVATCTVSVIRKKHSSGTETVPTVKYSIYIDKSDNGKVKTDPAKAEKGDKVTVTVTPDEGYVIDRVVVKDADGKKIELTEKGEGKYTFTMPDSKVEIDAKFVKAEAEPAAPEEIPAAEKIVLTINERVSQVFGNVVVNDVAPVIRGERTMLPIRFIAQALGAEVAWDDALNKVTITKEDGTIELYIGSPVAVVNGENIELDAPAFIENSRTYLPLRFVAEHLGAKVLWDAETQQVTILPQQ